jgi:hypothetical protein
MTNKQLFALQAELMYKVAYESCLAGRRTTTADTSAVQTPSGKIRRGGSAADKSLRLEAACVCNYATFIFRQKGDSKKAKDLFADGIRR